MTETKQVAVAPPKKIGEPKSIKEERERIEATRLSPVIKIVLPDGSFEQVDNVKVVNTAEPKKEA